MNREKYIKRYNYMYYIYGITSYTKLINMLQTWKNEEKEKARFISAHGHDDGDDVVA
jgi:hypothetical protein